MSLNNDILRSAHEIAMREGKDTNWSAFANRLRSCLLEQAGLSADTTDAQLILRATCTPRTFRQPREGLQEQCKEAPAPIIKRRAQAPREEDSLDWKRTRVKRWVRTHVQPFALPSGMEFRLSGKCRLLVYREWPQQLWTELRGLSEEDQLKVLEPALAYISKQDLPTP